MNTLMSCGFIARLLFFFIAIGGVLEETAYAYVGPGAGLTVIGTILALIAAFFLAVVGFVWYPVKRLLQKRNTSAVPTDVIAAEKAGQAKDI